MTRKDKLYSMNGALLIEVADKLGVKVACNRTRNQLKEAKAKVIERILEAEGEIDNEEPVEADTEVHIPQSEKVSEEPKENDKTKNKRTNLKLKELTYNGETKSIREWAAELEMPWPTLYDRVNRNGWSVEDAIETPLGQKRPK